MVVMEEMEPLDHRDNVDCKVLLVHKVHLVPGVLESHTPGGGRPPAQVYQELNWFIKEELEGVFTIIEEVEQTISVCLKTQSTLLDLQVELETTAMCLELNMRVQYQVSMITMYPVQYAMHPLGQLS